MVRSDRIARIDGGDLSVITHVAASASTHVAGPRLRTALLALVALAALVLSVLAMHSAASAHVMGIPLPISSSHSAEHATGAAPQTISTTLPDTALVTTAMTITTATTLNRAASHVGMLDCALMVMGCVMLLVLAALILFRRSALVQRSVASGHNLVSRIFAVEESSHRPSLSILCISRV
ncbi:hypothetical protein [Cryobacterium aureum]|uniref:hypothetical protein n=1 Tax=Cryobacterium aureum TaxID=995037 RepID=UPI000CF5144F|nr:hypothetical protein [Cryobacterium aureum]